jgi:carboxyl-terminal processing protease
MSGYTNDEIDFILWPVVAYVLNADGKADYVNGITPDYKLNERGLISPLLPLGDENELMLKNTLSLITTGTMPDAEKPEETETQSAKALSLSAIISADLFPLEPQETIMAAKAAAINTFFIIKSGF